MRIPFLSRLLEIKEWQIASEIRKEGLLEDILKELKKGKGFISEIAFYDVNYLG